MKYAIVYVICIVCLIGVGVLMQRIATSKPHSERGSTVTLQTLVESWKTSGVYNGVEDPATETKIKKAEAAIGAQLPTSLREVYQLFDEGWMWDLGFYQLDLNEHGFGLVNANEKYIEWQWHIPQEIRLFAEMGGEEVFGIWLAETGNPIYNHPIIEVGELHDEGCMGVAGTNLISFLRRWMACHLASDEHDKLEESGLKLSRIQKALDLLKVPQSLRGERFDYEMSSFTKWVDPQLPDPDGDSYIQQYTIGDLKQLFGEV